MNKVENGVYDKSLKLSVHRIQSFLNTDLWTSTAGSFDRHYWGWKKNDFEDATLAYAAVPLEKGLNRLKENSVFDFMQGLVVDHLLRLQHPDGSFDQSYPNELHPKVGLDVSSVFYSFLKQNAVSEVETAYKKLLEFSLKKEEKYALICNHLSHHAYEYLLAYDVFGDRKYYEKAVSTLKLIENNTDPLEGWHKEYFGADPGYQTRTLRYLTKCLSFLENNDKEVCLNICIQSARFLQKTVLPDGTLYGAFGSRNTELIYPSGIEFMARQIPEEFGSLAYQIRNAVKGERTFLPMTLEFDNFIRLFDDYLDAQEQLELNEEAGRIKPSAFQAQEFFLENYGLLCRRVGRCSIYIHTKYGGPIAVYREDEEVFKNAGLLIEDVDGDCYGTKNLHQNSTVTLQENSNIEIRFKLFKSVQEELTPLKLILLRLLNLTVLRIFKISDLFRNLVVKRLMIGEKNATYGGGIRKFMFSSEEIHIIDSLDLKFTSKHIWHARNLNLFHMASSRYFHSTEGASKPFKILSTDKYEKLQFDTKIEIDMKKENGKHN
jgi:hypothetical protein